MFTFVETNIQDMAIKYTKGEERTNYLSHGGGAVFGIVVGILLLIYCYRHENVWMQWGIWLYMFGMLGSYIASTVYHACSATSKWKERLRKWDHAAIYWHIAGSYSPITLLALREQGYWGWSLFIFIWLCAIVGTVMSFCKLKDHSNLETFCYVLMGLTVLVAFKPLIDSVSPEAVIWIIAEGVSYITGALFYTLHKKKYMHTVFHVFVLGGSVCHILAVWDMLKEYLQ
jgi:hemolysin III